MPTAVVWYSSNSVAAAARGHQFSELPGEIGGQPGMTVAGAEWRLVQDEPGDRQAGRGGPQGEGGAGGVAEQRRGPASGRDQRGDVLDLTLDSVRCRVAAVAPAPPVVVQHGEPRCQRSCQRLGL